MFYYHRKPVVTCRHTGKVYRNFYAFKKS